MAMKKTLILLLAAVMLLSALVGCGTDSKSTAGSEVSSQTTETAAQPAAETVVTVAIPADFGSMDPRQATNTNNTALCTNMYSTLLKTDKDYNIVLDAAESYEFVDEHTYKFTLKKGILFHDGVEMKTEDVQYTFDSIRQPDKTYRLGGDFNYMYIEPIDDYSFYLKMDTPNSSSLLRLGNMKIVPKHYIESIGEEAFALAPIGSGPYKFVSWEKDEQVVLEAFDEYFEGTPEIDKVIFKIIPESSARVAALEAGEVDLITAVSTNQVERLKATGDISVVADGTTRVVYFTLNTLEEGPLQDLRVRQAINAAIDRDIIVNGVIDGYGNAIHTFALPFFPNYNADLEGYSYDLEKAKELMAEAGYQDGFEIEIGGSFSSLSNGSDVAQIVAQQLAEIGIKATVIEKDSNTVKEEYLAGISSELTLTSFGGITNDVCYMNKIVLGSGQRYSAWADPVFDELVEKAVSSIEPKEQEINIKAVQAYAFDNACVVPLYQNKAIFAYNNRLQNWQPRVDEQILLYGASVK